MNGLRIQHIEKIKSMMRRCSAEKREINRKDFITEIMSQFNVSHRTAQEYLKVAEYEIR